MRFGRSVVSTLLATVCAASLAGAQATAPQAVSQPRIEKISPDAVTVSTAAVDITLNGRAFDKAAVVRVRTKGDRGTGADLTTTFDGPAQVRISLPATLVAKPAMLEIRVKNPDGGVSDWTVLEVRAAAAVPTPVIDRVTPAEVKALAREVFVTAAGRDFVDQAAVSITSSAGTTEVKGHAIREGLTFKVPDAHVARPGGVTFTVTNPGGKPSAPARFDVVAGAAGGGDAGGVTVVSVIPDRLDLRTATSATVKLTARGVDLMNARVLLRREGEASDGKIVPLTTRRQSGEDAELLVTLTKAMVRDGGNFELRVINPDGTQSNWARLSVMAGGGPVPGDASAEVTVTVPATATVSPATCSVAVDVAARNTSSQAVRIGAFRAVYADGTEVRLDGTLGLERGASDRLRLDVPIPPSAGAAKATDAPVQFAIAWSVSASAGRGPATEGRFPAKDLASIRVTNRIGLEPIGREYVAAPAPGQPEGWRFYKASNEANAGAGQAADFRLFANPFEPAAQIATIELYNLRPGAASQRRFYLTLTGAETAPAESGAGAERGTRLGYLAKEARVGLVPVYRWVLSDGRQAMNHYLTVEKDAAKLPRQMQRKGWKLDTTVGYAVPAAP